MSFTNQMPWSGVAGAPDGIVMVRTANFMTLLNGPPQGVLAGQSGSASVPPDMVWDWQNKNLYICTQSSGTPANTVWTQLEFVGPFVGTNITTVTLTATGTIQDQGTLNVTGAATLGSNLSVGGNTTITGNESVGGTLTAGGTVSFLHGGTLGGTFTGNPTFNFPLTLAQPLRLPNNIFVQAADTGGTYRNLIGVDTSNQVGIANVGGNVIGWLNQARSAWLMYSNNAGNVLIPGTLQVNSTVSTGNLTASYLGSTGSLVVNGNGQVGGTFVVGAGMYPNQGLVNIGGIAGYSIYNNGGNSLINFRANNYIQYDGNLNYVTQGTHYFSGNISTGNSITGGYVTSTGNVNANGTLTGGACNVGGGQVTCGDVHTTTVHADSTIQAQGEISTAGPMSSSTIITTATATNTFSFWQSNGAYIRMDGTYDYGPVPYASDARLKEDIQPADVDCLEVVRGMELNSFKWREGGESVPIGFTTQQLREVFPGAVNTEPADRPPGGTFYESVNINVMLALLTGAVQQLHAIVTGAES